MNVKKLSSRDVAKKAGVSISTVSYVINNDARIKEPTASKVRLAMKDLGYTPPSHDTRRGPRATQKAAEKSERVVLLYVKMVRPMFMAPIFASIAGGIEKCLRDYQINLNIRFIESSQDLLNDTRCIQNVIGAILFAMPPDLAMKEAMGTLPCVNVLGNYSIDNFADSVGVDDELIGYLAARQLLKNGHRHCAYIVDRDRYRREASFRHEIESAGGTVQRIESSLVIANENTHCVNRTKMEEVIVQLLSFSPRVTGVFSMTAMLTASAYPIMYECGIIPGKDIEVVSCNNEEVYMMNLHPRPAVIDTRAYDIGQRVVDQLLWRIKHPAFPLQRIFVRPELILP